MAIYQINNWTLNIDLSNDLRKNKTACVSVVIVNNLLKTILLIAKAEIK